MSWKSAVTIRTPTLLGRLLCSWSLGPALLKYSCRSVTTAPVGADPAVELLNEDLAKDERYLKGVFSKRSKRRNKKGKTKLQGEIWEDSAGEGEQRRLVGFRCGAMGAFVERYGMIEFCLALWDLLLRSVL